MRAVSSLVDAVLRRLVLALSDAREIQGLEVRTFAAEGVLSGAVEEKVHAAIDLLATHDPIRFRRIKRDLRCILITPTAGNLAEYHHAVRSCNLDPEYVASDRVSAALIAGTIAHEATHARLRSAGFGYPPVLRARIEKLCFEAEIAFGRRLPDGVAVIAHAERQLGRDPSVWTDQARRARAIAALTKLGTPRWVIRLFSARKPAA